MFTFFQAMSDKNCNRQVQDQYGLEYTYSDNDSSFLCFETQILNSASTVKIFNCKFVGGGG